MPTDNNLAERIASMKATAEKATKGDWSASGNGVHVGMRCVATAHAHDAEQRRADAAFIATCSPANINTLLARVEQLEREVAELSDKLRAAQETSRV